MPRRLYLSSVIGNGTENNPYRAKIANLGVTHEALIPSNADGTPRFNWCLVMVDAGNFSGVDNDPDSDGFPLVALDRTWGSLTALQRTRMDTMITRRGLTVAGLNITNATTIRQIIRRIVRHLDDKVPDDGIDRRTEG